MMKTVGELSRAILGLLKEDDAGRVALYHFLKNFHHPDETINPHIINQFYSETLLLPHWQQHRVELHNDVQELLQKFFANSLSGFRIDQVWDLSRLQLILIENPEDLFTVIKNHEQNSLRDGENLRVLREGGSKAICIRRTSTGEIAVTVRVYSNLVRISGDRLVPLAAEQEIFYDAGMELAQGVVQKLKHGPHNQCRFILRGQNQIEAQFVSGYAFRQSQTVTMAQLSDEPRIFYPLKRLESLFIYRPSDPYYMEVISTLDRAVQMLHSHADGAEQFAHQAFDGGQIAFDQIFKGDKALYLRLRELAKWMHGRKKEVKHLEVQSEHPETRHDRQPRPTPEIHR